MSMAASTPTRQLHSARPGVLVCPELGYVRRLLHRRRGHPHRVVQSSLGQCRHEKGGKRTRHSKSKKAAATFTPLPALAQSH